MRAAASRSLGPRSPTQGPSPGNPARATAAVPVSRPWTCALVRTCGPLRGSALTEEWHAPACARKRAYQRGARSSRTTRTRGGRKRPRRTVRTGGSGRHRRIYWRGSSGALPATCRCRCACSQKEPGARSWRRCQWPCWLRDTRGCARRVLKSARTCANSALT